MNGIRRNNNIMNKKWKILVTETIGELGINILKEAPDIELIQKKSM